MSRNSQAAEAAAAQASEAARALQARGQELRQEAKEPPKEESKAEPKSEPKVEAKRETLTLKRGNPDRDAAMEDIRRLRGEKEPEEIKDAPKAEKPAVEVKAAEPDKPVTATTEVPPVETVKAKVDGEEFDVPKAEVEEAGGLTAWQKAKAADHRLAKTNQALAEAQRERAALLEIARRGQPEIKQAPQPTEQDLMAKLAAARFGTDEEYAAALQDAISRNRVDPNAITNQALAAFEKNQAFRSFQTDYADLIKDPMALRLAASLETEFNEQSKKSGQPVDWHSAYRTIGTQVRNAFGRQSQPSSTTAVSAAATTAANPDQSQVSEKEARKASIVNLPVANARAAPTEDPKPESREESLNRMRKTRGQLQH